MKSREPRMPAADEALPGRTAVMPVPERHAVTGARLTPPFPEGSARAVFGLGCFWGADPVANQAMPAWVIVCHATSVVLSFAYAALLLQSAPRALIEWLAPAGRMPLTNYLLQSIAMGVLLTGWGFGLGTRLSSAQLSGTAAAIFVVQVIASRAWLAVHAQGPLEALWRWWTYRGAAPRVDPSRVTN